jgi:hypothetical protein
MAGVSDILEEIRDSLDDLPERLVEAMNYNARQPTERVGQGAGGKLKEAEELDPNRNFVNTPISEWFAKPLPAIEIEEAKKEEKELDRDELYENVFQDADKILENRPPDVEPATPKLPSGSSLGSLNPADVPGVGSREGSGIHGFQPADVPTGPAPGSAIGSFRSADVPGFPRGGAETSIDLAEIVPLLERIAAATEKEKPVKESVGESSGPARWRAPDPDETPHLNVRSKQTGRSLL